MAKIADLTRFQRKSSGHSPSGSRTAGENIVVSMNGAGKLNIPTDFKPETLPLSETERKNLICDCCKRSYATHKLLWLRKERISNVNEVGAGVIEQVFVPMTPPIVVRSCKNCLPRAEILAEAKLRNRHLNCNCDWVPMD